MFFKYSQFSLTENDELLQARLRVPFVAGPLKLGEEERQFYDILQSPDLEKRIFAHRQLIAIEKRCIADSVGEHIIKRIAGSVLRNPTKLSIGQQEDEHLGILSSKLVSEVLANRKKYPTLTHVQTNDGMFDAVGLVEDRSLNPKPLTL